MRRKTDGLWWAKTQHGGVEIIPVATEMNRIPLCPVAWPSAGHCHGTGITLDRERMNGTRRRTTTRGGAR